MKILRIIARLNVGGPARHVVWLSRAFADDSDETKLLAGRVPDGEIDMAYFAAENGVKPDYIEEMSRELSLSDVVSLYKILVEMWRFQPDIIHTHTAKAGTLGRVAALIYRIFSWKKVGIVHTFHGHVFHSYYGKLKTRLFILIERFLAFAATDRIIVISQQQLKEINETFGIGREEQFRVVPLGIDLEPFKTTNAGKVRQSLNIGEEILLTAIVGRLTEIKNIPLFLEAAFEYLHRPDVPEMKFIVVGDGHLRESLEAQAANRKIADSVLFIGSQTDIAAIYKEIDIVALTSLNEGTPLSLIEAMASSKPVISTAVGGVIDLLGEADDERGTFKICRRGIRIDQQNAKFFADGLIYLAKNEELQKKLGHAGSEYIESNYALGRLVADIKNIYNEITS